MVFEQVPPARTNPAGTIIYPAVADSVDLPEVSFRREKGGNAFALSVSAEGQPRLRRDAILADRVKALGDLRLPALLAPVLPHGAGGAIVVTVTGRRGALLKIIRDGADMLVRAHWNLFIPYFDRIKSLPITRPEILDIFARGVFQYTARALEHPEAAKHDLRGIVLDRYREEPELLLASLDIFNKTGIYHIRPTRIWLTMIYEANDRYRPQIDISAAAAVPLVTSLFLEELTSFIHKVVKNYAFRYGDYLWTQQYKITFGTCSGPGMISWEGETIVINIHPLIYQADWKPVVYLGLGYAVMFSILRSSGRGDREKYTYLALMKTWNRYLSFDESVEQQSVRDLCGFPRLTRAQQCRSLSECVIGTEAPERIDDFMALTNCGPRETPAEGSEASGDRHEGKTEAYFARLSNAIRDMNTVLMRTNINHGKLIEVLRSDGFDHLQLADLLRTGRIDDRSVVDVSEWLLLRTLLYDLINAPKVFQNDYKMLLKVLTKVNKSLLAFIWTLGLDDDPRFEMVSAYIAKVMNDIFVFDRIKIYEIVSDPVECLEAEAVTGYLLNWAGFGPEVRRSIAKDVLPGLPRNVVTQLRVLTTDDVDRFVQVMRTRSSGLIGFCLHKAYRWGSRNDPVTERIRSHFPQLLKQAQRVVLPTETPRGGTMVLLILAQIVSDQRDGFAGNIVITEDDRQTVRNLISQCIDWDQRHFVMMVAGMAAGYMGIIDGWTLQQFDTLLARYDGGDRVMLRSVVQSDVDNLIERTLITAGTGEDRALFRKIQLLRFGVDPVISDEANSFLKALASRYGLLLPDRDMKKKDIRELVLALSERMKAINVRP